MDISISYGDDSIYNLAFIKALLIKFEIEKQDLDYNQKEELRKLILKEFEKNL